MMRGSCGGGGGDGVSGYIKIVVITLGRIRLAVLFKLPSFFLSIRFCVLLSLHSFSLVRC